MEISVFGGIWVFTLICEENYVGVVGIWGFRVDLAVGLRGGRRRGGTCVTLVCLGSFREL
jgi:hypothetical protein